LFFSSLIIGIGISNYHRLCVVMRSMIASSVVDRG